MPAAEHIFAHDTQIPSSSETRPSCETETGVTWDEMGAGRVMATAREASEIGDICRPSWNCYGQPGSSDTRGASPAGTGCASVGAAASWPVSVGTGARAGLSVVSWGDAAAPPDCGCGCPDDSRDAPAVGSSVGRRSFTTVDFSLRASARQPHKLHACGLQLRDHPRQRPNRSGSNVAYDGCRPTR